MSTGTVRDFTRGGQTLLHFLRMVSQVLSRFITVLILAWGLFVAAFFYTNTDGYDRYLTVKWVMTRALVDWGNSNRAVPFRLRSGQIVSKPMAEIVRHPFVRNAFDRQWQTLKLATLVGSVSIVAIFSLICVVITRTGSGLRNEKRLRGGRLVSPRALATELYARGKASDITLASVPLLKNAETSHMLITGSPGSGKSVAIRQLLDVIEARQERAIIYSSSTEFIRDYYQASKDVILNPLDARSPVWTIWNDCQLPTEFDQLAASLIPENRSGADPFWNRAAQTLFSVMAQKVGARKNPTTKELLQEILNTDLEAIGRMVQGTEAYSLVDPKSEKTALSIKATLAAYAKSLKYLRADGSETSSFSIRDWVKDETSKSWIFMSARADQKDALRPLLSMWLDTLAAAILALEDDPKRRIWVIIDELPSLNRLPSLNALLAMGRKYGACGVLGFQSYAQLCDIYGRNGADEITGLCSTWLMYRSNEPQTMEWCSKALGGIENEETREGISYGANEIRDGVSLSTNRQVRPLVLSSEFKNLQDLNGYLRLPGDLPVAKFKLDYKHMNPRAEGLIPIDPSQTCWSL